MGLAHRGLNVRWLADGTLRPVANQVGWTERGRTPGRCCHGIGTPLDGVHVANELYATALV